MLFWNTCINGKIESKSKKIIPTRVIQLFISWGERQCCAGEGVLGGPLGSSTLTIKAMGQIIPGRGNSKCKGPYIGKKELTRGRHGDVPGA